MVVLANSTKNHGACVAGRYMGPVSGCGSWIRPVLSDVKEGVPVGRTFCKDGVNAKVLDIIRLPLGESRPFHHQKENRVLETGSWERDGCIGWNEISMLADSVGNELWLNGYSSSYGHNDLVPDYLLDEVDGSLLLVHVTLAHLFKRYDLYGKEKIRAMFMLGGCRYNLAVTDPVVSGWMKGREILQIPEAYFCISLAVPYKGSAYKLVASVITPGRAKGIT